MPDADSAPGECFSVAHYRLLHHIAVSFVSSDISRRHGSLKRAGLMPAADSAPGVCTATTATRALARMCTLNSGDCLMCGQVW